jgi:hypothetical protein
MTPQEAWEILRDNIRDDCGPVDEGWPSEELLEAVEVFQRIYRPDLTLKVLFPNSPMYWAPSDRPKAHRG